MNLYAQIIIIGTLSRTWTYFCSLRWSINDIVIDDFCGIDVLAPINRL